MILWKGGARERALAAWERAARLTPGGAATRYLRRARARVPSSSSPGAPELLRAFEFRADWRRQREVEEALAAARAELARDLPLRPENSELMILDLFRRGYLEVPGGPPSGRGTYLTDALGHVSSTEFGSHRFRDRAPPLLREGRDLDAPTEVLLEVLRGGSPAAFEFGLDLLSSADLRAHAATVASAAASLRDPHAVAAVLARLDHETQGERPGILEPFRAFLRETGRGAEPLLRFRALALLRRAGAPEVPAVGLGELDLLFNAHRAGLVPPEAIRVGLDGLRGRAELYLLSVLTRCGTREVGSVLELLEEYGGRDSIRALADGLAGGHPAWEVHAARAYRTLAVIAGARPGDSPGAWKEWLRENG